MMIENKKKLRKLYQAGVPMVISIVLIGIMIFSLNSCQKQNSILKTPAFSLKEADGTPVQSTLAFSGDSIEKKFNIVSDGHWDIVTGEDWISVSPQSGDKNGEITVKVKENTDNERKGTIRFITDTLRIDTFFISQKGLNLFLSVEPEEIKGFPADGGDTTLRIEAGDNPWEYSIDNPAWLAEKERTDSTLTLTVANNVDDKERATGITFRLSARHSFSQTVQFSQLGSAVPRADLLDVMFNSDKTAKDTSPLHLPVEYMSKSKPVSVAYNDIIKRNVVYFDPPVPGSWLNYQGSWYHVEYKDNSDFIDKVADGFSMACLVKFDINFQTDPQSSAQTFFSMFEGGGAGFSVTKADNNLVFQVSISKNTKINNSNIVPDNNTWYYLVGVWDKDAGKTYIYVNGEKKAEMDDAAGDYTPPSVAAGADWLCIGGGLAWQTIGEAFKGGIAVARIYDKPLTSVEIKDMWKKVEQLNN